MRLCSVIMLAAFAFTCGCASISRKPNAAWLDDFDHANAVVVSREGHPSVTITDRETMDRLREIYANASWKPYIGTIPADIGQRTIAIAYQDDVLRRFTTSLGMLWEDGPYDEMRTTELGGADSRWIESLFDQIPDAQEQTKE